MPAVKAMQAEDCPNGRNAADGKLENFGIDG